MLKLNPSLFFQKIINEYQNNGIVGEDANIVKVFLSAISRYLPPEFRIHIIVFSQSSAGKTTLLKIVTEPFKEDVKTYSRFTGAALDRTEESFNGKIFLYEQMQGFEATNLKILLSEGELKILVVERNDETGKMHAVEKKLSGTPIFMTTATTILDDEMINRVMPLSMNESEDQSKAIVRQQAKNYCDVNINDSNDKWCLISSYDKIYREIRPTTIAAIKIPFIKTIAEKIPLPVTIRRDFKRLMTLIQLIAYAKHRDPNGQYMRPIIELAGKKEVGYSSKIIVALPEDFEDALWCYGALDQSLNHLFGRSKEVHDELCKLVTPESENGATVRDITKNLHGIQQKTVYNYCEMLVTSGLATKEKKGYTNIYYPTNKNIETMQFNIKFTKEDLNKWIKEQVGDLAKEIFIPENEFKDSVFSDSKGGRPDKPDLSLIDRDISNISSDRPISDKNGYLRLLPLLSKNDVKKIDAGE